MFSNHKSRPLKSITVLLCVCAIAVGAGFAAPVFADPSRDEVVSVVNELKAAWEALDMARLEALFDLEKNIEYYPAEMMKVHEGGEGIRTYLKDAVNRLSEVKLIIRGVRAEAFGDTAYAAFMWRFEYEWDGTPLISDGRTTLVLRKKEGRWKIIHYHESVPTQ